MWLWLFLLYITSKKTIIWKLSVKTDNASIIIRRVSLISENPKTIIYTVLLIFDKLITTSWKHFWNKGTLIDVTIIWQTPPAIDNRKSDRLLQRFHRFCWAIKNLRRWRHPWRRLALGRHVPVGGRRQQQCHVWRRGWVAEWHGGLWRAEWIVVNDEKRAFLSVLGKCGDERVQRLTEKHTFRRPTRRSASCRKGCQVRRQRNRSPSQGARIRTGIRNHSSAGCGHYC